MQYTRNSKTRFYTREELNRFYAAERDFKENYLFSKNILTEKSTRDIITRALLDSSLIFQTNYKSYTHKIIKVGDYYQIYDYKNSRLKKDKDLEKNKYQYIVHTKKDEQLIINNEIAKEYEKFYNNPMYLNKNRVEGSIIPQDIPVIIKHNSKLKTIDIKNINRSKFELQRIVKANEKEFKTFITLTIAENIKDIDLANKYFNSFITYIKKLKNDFKYVCVPEFQKRGAIHYHLLTNINYNDHKVINQEEKKLWNKSSKTWQIGKPIKGWNKGFSLSKDISSETINIVGYITKYMTKDIDNRLWGKRRYHYSRNLIKPTISYIDINKIEDFSYLVDITSDKEIIYKTNYNNIYNENISFTEYKTKLIF